MASALTGYRQFYLTIRVRDEASRGAANVSRALQGIGDTAEDTGNRMRSVGSAMASIGTSMIAVGAAGAGQLTAMTQEALSFSQGAAYAFTQVDEMGSSVEELKQISRNVAAVVPVPLEQITEGLYDLFSSVDVAVADSEETMIQFSKASIAGQTDIRTAARATVRVMNAYEMGAEDINKILDFQFQLVRKGIGTYDDFAGTIGLALPAFRAADQDLDTLGGTLTFLTRNGLSASRAATSAARAVELMAQPKSVENLRALGVEVTNADGTFREINQIVTDLAEGPFKDLQGPEFREAFKEIFGSGRIQARRFFDIALKNTDEYNQRIDEMRGAMGAMESAYDIMYNEPIMRSQELRVQFDLLKEEVGVRLIPTFEGLVEKASEILDMWNDLDEATKDQAVRWAAIASAATLLAGAFVGLSGLAVLTMGALSPLFALIAGIGIRALVALAGVSWPVWVAIGAIAAIAYVVYRNWDTLVAFWNDTVYPALVNLGNWFIAAGESMLAFWHDTVYPILVQLGEWFVEAGQKIAEWATAAWNILSEWAVKVAEWLINLPWMSYWETLKETTIFVVQTMVDTVLMLWNGLKDGVTTAIEAITAASITAWNTIWETLAPIFEAIAGAAVVAFEAVRNVVVPVWDEIFEKTSMVWNTIWENLSVMWQQIVDLAGELWPLLVIIWNTTWHAVKEAFKATVDVLTVLFQTLWEVVGPIWDMISSTIYTASMFIWETIEALIQLVTAVWDPFWYHLKEVAKSVWDTLWTLIDEAIEIALSAINAILAIFRADWSTFWNELKDIFFGVWNIITSAFNLLWDAFQLVWQTLGPAIQALPDIIVELLGDGIKLLAGWAGDIISGLISALIDLTKGGFHVAGRISEVVLNIVGWFADVGMAIASSIINGMFDGLRNIFEKLSEWVTEVVAWFTDLGSKIATAILDGIGDLAGSILDKIPGTGVAGDVIGGGANVIGGVVDFFNPFGQRGLLAMAGGGVVNGPQQALIGEAGAEAVIPLSRPADAADIMDAAGLSDNAPNITVNVYGGDGGDAFAQKVARAVGEEIYANGY